MGSNLGAAMLDGSFIMAFKEYGTIKAPLNKECETKILKQQRTEFVAEFVQIQAPSVGS